MSTAAVNEVADTMAATSISNPTNGTANETATTSADEGRRLYIGNLAYATTEGELKDFFKAYNVESTSIPVHPRTNRPVGYAFVDLATAQEAQAAIAELSGKEILERKVSVQLARKPEPAEVKEGAEGEATQPRKRGYGRRGRGRGRGGRFGRGGRARQQQNGAKPAGEAAAGTEGTALANVTNANNAGAQKNEAGVAKPAPRPRKQRGPPENGIPSKTKVMVANLPYDLSEERLKELFAAYEPVSAKIALRPIPRYMIKKLQARNEPRKGRGFGFVTLSSEAMQERAVKEMHGKEIEGREIAVKVAIDSPGKEDDATGATAQPEETPAAAEATTTTEATPAAATA
ncbi:hypothetical protein VTO42DRAFT_7501 [Malbranchea cinnamomea]